MNFFYRFIKLLIYSKSVFWWILAIIISVYLQFDTKKKIKGRSKWQKRILVININPIILTIFTSFYSSLFRKYQNNSD